MRINHFKILFLIVLLLTKCEFHQMAINPYDWKKIDPSAVENGFTISFGTEFKIVNFTKN